MRAMADSVVAGGILMLVLVIAATILSVTFATRGAMAANRPMIEVLHFIGARTASSPANSSAISCGSA